MSQDQRTIFGREVPFPLRDPYGPAVKARIPIPGLTRWPGREVLGRHYYGLDTEETAQNNAAASAVPGKIVAFNAEPVTVVNPGDDEISGFSGFADNDLECAPHTGVGLRGLGDLGALDFSFLSSGGSGVTSGGGQDQTEGDSGGGIDWGAIIQAGIHAAPAIIQASEGGGAPYNYYQVAQTAGTIQQTPAGYTRNAQGQLIPLQSAAQVAGGLGVGVAQIGNSLSNFVTQNPLLVLGAGFALVLLFMKPPSRR